MAIPFKNNIDLGSNQLLNALLQKEPAHPQNPVAGQIYYNTSDKRAYYYNGSTWIGMDADDARMTGGDIIDSINEETNKKISILRVDVDVFTDTKDGLVPSGSAGTTKYLREDGSWVIPPNDDTTYEVFTKDKSGLVPKGSEGTTKYLREDGSWVIPPNDDTTYEKFTSTKDGLVPKGSTGTTKYLREDGGWEIPPDTNTTYNTFTNTEDGLVPKGSSGTTKYLREDGGWVAPPDTTYTEFSSSKSGLVPKGSTGTVKYLREDGGWQAPPNDNTTYTDFSSSKSGLVPKGSTGSTKFLREDGGWQTPAYPTKNTLGLDKVTNDKQIKAGTSSVDGNIPAWDGTGADKLKSGYGVQTNLTELVDGTADLATAAAVKSYIDDNISAIDVMRYMGVINASSNPNYPAANKGDTYKISAAGKIGGTSGVTVEVGDMIIALESNTGGNQSTAGAKWNVIQANIDGAVIGPASAVNNNFAAFDQTTGKLIKDSGSSAASFAKAVHDHTGVHPKKYSANLTANATQTVTHGLNTEDVVVMIREASGNKQQVYADVKITGVNTISITMSTAPAAGQYRVTVIG